MHTFRSFSSVLALGLLSLAAQAQVNVVPFNLSTPTTNVFNDRIGNSRFFNGPNTDRVRVSAFLTPTPDSDVFIATNSSGQQFRSTNGANTSVTVTHASFGNLLPNPRPLTFVGLTSSGGGGRNEFTTSFNRANADVAPLLDAWAATPFSVTATNPTSPNGITEITVDAAAFDKNAMPDFVTDLKVTSGLTPTLTWMIPATTVPQAVSIQIRSINAESADGSRITSATLLHSANLPASATTYTIGTLSNAALLGLPSTLQLGQKYEIAVQLDLATAGALKGRSRTFFEYTPLTATSSNVAVFLPSLGPSGTFKFNVTVNAGETIDIDPAVAVGYIYETGPGDPNFRSVALPNVGDGRYTVEAFDTALGGYRPGFAATAGTVYDFVALGWPDGVAKFRVKGIEASAALDPTNTTAFVTTVAFMGSGRFTGTMVPVVGYELGGFGSPVNAPPTVTSTRVGATLPLKWSITDKQNYAVTDLAAVAGVTYKPTACAAFTTDPTDGTPAAASGGTRLRYDSTTAQYVFNWKTPDAPGCYSLFVALDTQQLLQANVMLTP